METNTIDKKHIPYCHTKTHIDLEPHCAVCVDDNCNIFNNCGFKNPIKIVRVENLELDLKIRIERERRKKKKIITR